MMTINKDKGIKIAKRLSIKENLSDLRNLLGDKISINAIFISNDGSEIDYDDEKDTEINDIIDNKKIYMKTIKDKNEIPIEIYVNQELKYSKNLSKEIKLNKIREICSDIMIKDAYFVTNEGAQIDLNDENETTLDEILDGNKLNIKSSLTNSAPKPIGLENESDDTSSGDDNIKEEKLLIEFYLDNEIKCNKKILNTEKLINIRKLLSSKITQEFNFISKEDNEISQSEENNLKLYKIIKDKNKINLKSVKEISNAGSVKLIEIYLNEQLNTNKKLNISEELPKIRKILSKKIPQDYQFVFPNGLKIDIDEEEEYILEDIINNNKLNLYCSNSNNTTQKIIEEKNKDIIIKNDQPAVTPDNNSLNTPLEGSNFIEESGNLKIYNYPKYEFTSEEQKNSKKIMVIGPTGTGKTTLLII